MQTQLTNDKKNRKYDITKKNSVKKKNVDMEWKRLAEWRGCTGGGGGVAAAAVDNNTTNNMKNVRV